MLPDPLRPPGPTGVFDRNAVDDWSASSVRVRIFDRDEQRGSSPAVASDPDGDANARLLRLRMASRFVLGSGARALSSVVRAAGS